MQPGSLTSRTTPLDLCESLHRFKMGGNKREGTKKCWVIQEEAKVTLATSCVGGVFSPDASGHPLKMSRDRQTSAVKKANTQNQRVYLHTQTLFMIVFLSGKTHSAKMSVLPQSKHGGFVWERDRDLSEVKRRKWSFIWWYRQRLTLEKSLWTADRPSSG